MACRDPWLEGERVEVRWLRPDGQVAVGMIYPVDTPQAAVEGLARAWTALIEEKESLNETQRICASLLP